MLVLHYLHLVRDRRLRLDGGWSTLGRGATAMHRIMLYAAVCAGLPIQAALSQDIIPVNNVTIDMVRHGGKGSFRIDAKISNPNDFAVFDVHVNCNIRDRRGNNLASYASTIIDAIQAKEVKTVRRLDIGAWPVGGKTASCLSSEAKKLPAP